MTLPNGIQTTYSYDPASQVTQILHKITATNTSINNADYLYNQVGNRTQLTDRRGTQAFGYDNLDRLISATHPLPPTSQTFTYDPVGNRTFNGSLSNAGNQLTENAQFIFEYDDNGNQTKKTSKATNNFTVYTYDAENRLIQVQDFVAGNPTAIATSTYRYDGLGRRIEKVGNGLTRRYVYDRDQILFEYDGANVLQARYTHSPGIDEPIAVTRGSSTYFYHQDGLGTVTELTDSSGTVAKSYAYDGYGNIVDPTGTAENIFTYTGRELDSEAGLYYYRARSYDPRTGRFLQKDPIGFKGGDANLYRYVSNSPVSFNDPLGLQCSCGEEITAMAAVGPLDAYRANQLGEEAFKKADATGFPGRGSGVRDAFRHCYWSCRMAQEIGPDQAKKVGDIHEECERGASAVGDTAMDLKNNSVGRAYGTPGADCYFSCAGAVKSGVLQTSPGGTVPKGSIY